MVAHAQTITPTLNRVCQPLTLTPASSNETLYYADFTVPDNGTAYNMGFLIQNSNDSPFGFNIGALIVFDPDNNLQAYFPYFGNDGGSSNYERQDVHMVPGTWRIYHEGNHNNPNTLSESVSVCYLELDPEPEPEQCELLQLEYGAETGASIPFTSTRYYSSTAVGAVYNGPLGFLLGGFTLPGFGDFDGIIGTGDWAYSLYTETFAITPTTYALDLNGAGGNAPYYPYLAIYGCAPDVEPPPIPPLVCDLVEEPDFSVISSTAWSVFGGATISNSVLSLPTTTAQAEQVLSWTNTISQNLLYRVFMTGTGTTTGTDTLIITLLGGGVNQVTVELTDTMGLTVTIPVSNDLTFPSLVLSVLTGALEIDYICLSGPHPFGFGEYYECLNQVVQNGEFDDPGTPWSYNYGALHNGSGDNAWLPHVPTTTIDIFTGTRAVVAQSSFIGLGIPPQISPNEYLILQFDARNQADRAHGGLTSVYRNFDVFDEIILTTTVETYPEYWTFQTDMTALAGETGDMAITFWNDSQNALIGNDAGVFLDNVCLFVSPDPITLPVRTGGEVLDAGLPFNCFNLSQWLSDTVGIDFPALETLADTTPSIWDPDEWVPWLASKLWVNVAKPTACLLIAMYNGFALPVLNTMLWLIGEFPAALAWMGSWVAAFMSGFGLWLLWFSGPLGQVIAMAIVLTSAASTGFSFFGEVLDWAWSIAQLIPQYWAGLLIAWVQGLFNFFIAAWNTLLPSISIVLGKLIGFFVSLWNDVLAPWLSQFSGIWDFVRFMLSQAGILGDLIIFFLSSVWGMVQTIWSMVTGLGSLPLTFYYEFEGSVNGTGYDYIPVCTGDLDANQFCLILAGLQIVDVAISHSIVYPLTIVGIIIATFVVFRRHIWGLISFDFR